MRQLRALFVLLPVVLLSACVVVPYPRQGGYYGPVAGGSGAMVNAPTPYVEVVPAIPFPGALWIGGYWGWGGGKRQWVPGRWEQPRHGHSGHQ